MAEEAKKDAAPKAAAKAPAAKAAAPKAAAAKAPAAKAPAAKAASTKAPAAKAADKPATTKAAADKAPAAKAAAPKATAAKATTDEKAAAAPKSTAAPARKKAAAKSNDVARPQVLKVHHLRPAAGAKKAKTRVGRGEGSKGKTAGRGTKGTKARYQVKAGLEGGNLNFIMRSPKLRGFKNPFRVEYQVVNLEKLAELYPKGGNVTIGDLVAKGAVRKDEKVKVLGNGDIAVKLNVAVDKVSGSAEQKILAAGGSVK
jgi:large subunit ribosomal protein L15